MKKKNGFTLIELLGVLVLIAVIALISFLVIDKNLKSSKQKMYDKQIETIELAAHNWGSDNLLILNEISSVRLGTLKVGAYVDYDISDPITGKCFSNNTTVNITKTEGTNSYIYTIDEDSIYFVECSLFDSEQPLISIERLTKETEFLTTTEAFLIMSNISGIDKSKIKLETDASSGSVSKLINLDSVVETKSADGNYYIMELQVETGTTNEQIWLKIDEGAVKNENGLSTAVESDKIVVKGKKPEITFSIDAGNDIADCNSTVTIVMSFDSNTSYYLEKIKVKGEPLSSYTETIDYDLFHPGHYFIDTRANTITVWILTNEDLNEIVIEEGAFVTFYGSTEVGNEKITKTIGADCFELNNLNLLVRCDNDCAKAGNQCSHEEILKGVKCRVMTQVFNDNGNILGVYKNFYVLWNNNGEYRFQTSWESTFNNVADYGDEKMLLIADYTIENVRYLKEESDSWRNDGPTGAMDAVNRDFTAHGRPSYALTLSDFKYDPDGSKLSHSKKALFESYYGRLPSIAEVGAIYDSTWYLQVGEGFTADYEGGPIDANEDGVTEDYEYRNSCILYSPLRPSNINDCFGTVRPVIVVNKSLVVYSENIYAGE